MMARSCSPAIAATWHDPGQWKHLNDGPIREITMNGVKRAHTLYERSTPTCMESPMVNAPHMQV